MARLSKETWLQVESDYRAAVLSLPELGKKYGCTPGAISQKAAKLKWARVPAELKRQLVEQKLHEQAKTVGDSVRQILEVEADHDAAVLNRAARTLDKILQITDRAVDEILADKSNALLGLDKINDTVVKATAGYTKVRKLDDKPPEKSEFEGVVRKLMEGT